MPELDLRPTTTPDDPDRTRLLEAVTAGGALAMTYFGTAVETWDKADKSPVSQADLAVNALLRERLDPDGLGYGWLSEETEDDQRRLDCEHVWVVDPIDGTRAFLRHKPHFTIAVALLRRGYPVLAAIFNPATGEMFEAVAGHGAHLNATPIQTSTCAALEGCRMLGPRDMFEHPAWPRPWPPMEIATFNSIAYRLALVAGGGWDATVSLTRKNDWDLAAADLILREAGARMTDHAGEGFRFNASHTRHRSVIAAGPALHAEILARTGPITLP